MSAEAQAASGLRVGMHFETLFSRDFITRFLPLGGARVLEVGCGTGELAASLESDGLGVVAIDSDSDSVAAARLLGVDARVAQWPDFNDGSFDAVLFTQSLHHINPLPHAVQRAAECLQDGGRVIVEDFDCESADEKTLRWFASAIRLLKATSGLRESNEFLEKMMSERSPLEVWRNHHRDHDVHSATRIASELEALRGEIVREESPYYFRYLASAMGALEKRDAIIEALAGQEAALIADGAIVPLGRRFVVTPRSRNTK